MWSIYVYWTDFILLQRSTRLRPKGLGGLLAILEYLLGNTRIYDTAPPGSLAHRFLERLSRTLRADGLPINSSTSV